MIKNQLFIAAALLVGVAIGFFVDADGKHPQSADAKAPIIRSSSIADKGEAASLAALRARIAELERQLAASRADRPIETPLTNAVAASPQPQQPPRNPREWMENLKKNDPARYAEMTNRFARFRARHQARQQARLDFLSSVDTSRMSASAKKTHEDLQSLIARRDELMDIVHAEGTSDADRESAMQELHSIHGQMRTLNQAERENLLGETVKTLGFEGEDAAMITSTIKDVVDATQEDFGGPHRGGPGGPPPGMGGKGPGGPGPNGP